MTHSSEQFVPSINDILQNTPYREREVLDVYSNGEFSKVVRLSDNTVVKMSRNYESPVTKKLTTLEACTLARLSALDGDPSVDPAPIRYPLLLDVNIDDGHTPFIAYKYIEGEILTSPDIVYDFSFEEKRQFGWKVGESVAWLAQHFPQTDHYQDIEAAELEGYKRPSILDYSIDDNTLEAMIEAGLDIYAGISTDIRNEYYEHLHDGRLDPVIAGHDDLQLRNMAFDGRELNGVFDFGEMKATTCERELRHIAHLGDDVLLPAMQAYEQATAQQVDRDLVMFWAKLQTAMNSGYRRLSGSYYKQPDEPLKLGFLQEQYPNNDFSTLYPDFQ